jgi:hypothetical protein
MYLIWMILLIHYATCFLVMNGQACDENPLYCPWVIFLGENAPREAFNPYNPIVLDPDHFSAPIPEPGKNKIVYAYFSLGAITHQ